MNSFELTALLACPRCDQSLQATATHHECRGCSVQFPKLGAVPFLFAEPDYALGEWRSRYRHEQARSNALSKQYAGALAGEDLLPATADRLQRLQSGLERQSAALADLLTPMMAPATDPSSRETFLALRTRLPSDQGLNTYFPNVFRDWAWGEPENRKSIDIVSAAVDEIDCNPQKILVLGAGAGRLTADIAARYGSAEVVGLDFNPMLMLLAAEMTAGKKRTFVEFPLAPITARDVAVEQHLKSNAKPTENCHWLVGDALRPPFAAGSFDLVVTPWLLDILDASAASIALRVNRVLGNSGIWLNFGSLSFRRPDPRECMTRDELAQQVTEHGFDALLAKDHEIPYLDSPVSRHARTEKISTLTWRKSADVEDPGRYRALPDWVVTGKQPVPATDALQQQAAATRIHAFIMSMIDGKRSLEDMSALMEAQKLMSRDDARDAIRGMLIKMYDEANRYGGF